VGFLFDLDEMLYVQLVTVESRQFYTEQLEDAPRARPECDTNGVSLAIFVASNFMYFIDMACSVLVYLGSTQSIQYTFETDPSDGSGTVAFFRINVFCRLSVFTLTEMYIAYCTRRDAVQSTFASRATLVCRTLVYGALLMGFGFMVYSFLFSAMMLILGFRPPSYIESFSDTMEQCLQQTDTPDAPLDVPLCQQLSQSEELHPELMNRTVFWFFHHEAGNGMSGWLCYMIAHMEMVWLTPAPKETGVDKHCLSEPLTAMMTNVAGMAVPA